MGAIIVSIFVSVVAGVGGIYFYIQDHNNKSCTRCKAFPTTCKILHEVGFFRLVWGRFVSLQLVRMVFRSFLSPHLGRTFLPLRSKVLTAVWACRPLHPL